MKNISTSPDLPNMMTNNQDLPKNLVINEKMKLKADVSAVRNIKHSKRLTNASRLLEFAIECSSWLSNCISNKLVTSITKQFEEYMLSPLSETVRVSMYFFKISSSLDAAKKLDKIKKDFSDVAFVRLENNKSRSKTLKELQKEREDLFRKINEIQTDQAKTSFKLAKLRKLSSPFEIKAKKNLQPRELNKRLKEKIYKLKLKQENLESILEHKKHKLSRLSEYTLIVDLEKSNKTKFIESSILFVHSLITFATNTTVSVLSTLATITVNPFIVISSNILWWNNKILHYSELGQMVFDYVKKLYLNGVKIKRADILLKKIDALQETVILSHSKLGNKPLNQSDIDLLDRSFGLPDEVRQILSTIGRTFITAKQVDILSTFLSGMSHSHELGPDDTQINQLITDLKDKLSDYEKHIVPLTTSMLGDEPISPEEFSSLDFFGIPKNTVYPILDKGVGKRFVTLEEVGILMAYFRKIQAELPSKSLSDSDATNINNLLSRFSKQFANYEQMFVYGDIDISKIIESDNAFSSYLLMLRAKADSKNLSVLKTNWIDRLAKGNLYSAYSNYILKVFDYFEENFEASQSFKNDLLTVKNNEWGKVWKLFHPYRTNDIKERARRDNSKFLLSLIGAVVTKDFKDYIENPPAIDWNNPKKIHEVYEQYSQCEHLCCYINALAAINSKSRKKLFLSLDEHINKHKEFCIDDAIEIIKSQF